MIPRWSTLRTIGQSRLAQATIFIPILGYLFVFNQEITEYFKLIPRLGGGSTNEAADVNLSRIICLYLGLSCIGIGSIIFSVFCPSEISSNADEHEFNVKEMDVMTPFRFDMNRRRIFDLKGLGTAEVRDEVDRLKSVVLSDSIGAAEARVPELRGHGLAWDDWIDRNKGNLLSVITVTYYLLDRCSAFARFMISILYLIGASFLSIPSSQVFFRSILLIKTLGQYLFPW